jgi:hypothetical protein
MKMQQLLNEWKKFVNEASRNFLESNISKIMEVANDQPLGGNTTSDLIYEASREQFRDFLVDNNLANLFRTYEIKDLIGAGAVGLAFQLAEPHENYVMKLQITETTSRFSNIGTEYPTTLHTKQSAGDYDPKEINVLESVNLDNVAFEFGGRINPDTIPVNVSVFVYSKVSSTAYSGKQAGEMMTAEEAYKDFTDSESEKLMRALYYLATDPTNLARVMSQLSYALSNLGVKDSKQINEISNKIMQAYNGGGVRAAAGVFYKVAQPKMKHLSKEQYISLCEAYFKHYSAAMSGGKPFDFHGGNFGFRQKSDVPAPFDI